MMKINLIFYIIIILVNSIIRVYAHYKKENEKKQKELEKQLKKVQKNKTKKLENSIENKLINYVVSEVLKGDRQNLSDNELLELAKQLKIQERIDLIG